MNPSVTVVCLCAAWCRLCDDYARVLEQVRADCAAAGRPIRTAWIDIEDDAELVGDFDVETFPTVLVLTGTQLRFAGAVTPEPPTLQRLLRALAFDTTPGASLPVDAAALALAQRLLPRLALA